MLYFCIRFWAFSDDPRKKDLTNGLVNAAIAQLVEHDLAKVGVASSSLVCRSPSKDEQNTCSAYFFLGKPRWRNW